MMSEESSDDTMFMNSPNSRLAINTKDEVDRSVTSDKICKICGDRAVGYNFGIITCESCKAFFRRNAGKEKDIKCPFSNACEINKLSRRYCQSCRLQKCLKVIKMGMKTDWLTSEKSHKLRSPGAKHKLSSASPGSPILSEIEKCGVMTSDEVRMPKHMFEKLIKKAQQLEAQSVEPPKKCTCKCQCGFYPPETELTAALPSPLPATPGPSSPLISGFSQISLPDTKATADAILQTTQTPTFGIMPSPSFASNLYNPWCINHKPKTLQEYMTRLSPQNYIAPQAPVNFPSYEAFGLTAAAATDYTRNIAATNSVNAVPDYSQPIPDTLSAFDRVLMQELVDANRGLKAPMDVACNVRSEPEISILTVVKITDLAMRRIISMAKMLSLFNEQTQSDKIAILKGSLSELLILRGVMVFDPVRDVWRHDIYQGSKEIKINVDILKKTPEQKHYAEHKKFLLSFDDKWRRNENVMLILNAITLFCPSRPNIKNVANVQSCQRRYYELLKRYLDTQCPQAESRQAYDSLLRKLVDLHKLNESLLRIYSHVNPNDLDPLLKELFDIYPLPK